MKYLLILVTLFYSVTTFAQVPEDALRVSWNTPTGTARQQAIGGAMGSLGGEISTLYANPAGLGLYKTSEFVISPGYYFNTNKATYFGNKVSGGQSGNFNIGTSGIVLGFNNGRGGSSSFGLAVNRTANFGSHLRLAGANNYSSGAEQYAEEFSNSQEDINNAIGDPSISYGTRMGLYTYLVDTATVNGNLQVITQPEKVLAAGGSLNQSSYVDTKGGITEIALGLAGNYHDKWYVGASLGIPIVSYTRDLTYTESDASGNNNNDFSNYTYREHFTSKGAGLNLKVGAIYSPQQHLRLGLTVITPTLYALTDRLTADMITNSEGYAQERKVTSGEIDAQSQTFPGEIKYDVTSPWKFTASGAYLFGNLENVKSQKGFITADIEYATNKSSRFSSQDQNVVDNGYYDAVNSTVKSYYKGSFNARIGGELKFERFAARAGFAFYASPYQQSSLKASRMLASAGIGYREKGMFIDLTYVAGFNKDVYFPYRLSDKDNLYATTKQTTGTAILTIGFKLP